MQFKQDDKAICTLTDGEVEIQFGPYNSTNLGMRSYLVKWLDGVDKGRCSVVGGEDLEPASQFKVGQAVVSGSDTAELSAGPFPDYEGDSFWVVRLPEGSYAQWWEMYMKPSV